MLKNVWVTIPDGSHLDLSLTRSEVETGLVIFNIEGLGTPKATVNGVQGPGFDGVRVSSVKADARHLVLSLVIPGKGDTEEVARDLVYRFFPVKQQIQLGIETDNDSVYIDAYVESVELSHFAKIENATVSLYSSDPWFKNFVEWIITINEDSDSEGNFSFPFSNESLTEDLLLFGTMFTEPTGVIRYPTGVATGCQIEMFITGTVSEVTITNTNGNQEMSIDAIFLAGDIVRIDTRYGQKSAVRIRNGLETNILGTIDMYSDWLEIRPGNNYVVVDAVVGAEYISTDIRFRPLRGGI